MNLQEMHALAETLSEGLDLMLTADNDNDSVSTPLNIAYKAVEHALYHIEVAIMFSPIDRQQNRQI